MTRRLALRANDFGEFGWFVQKFQDTAAKLPVVAKIEDINEFLIHIETCFLQCVITGMAVLVVLIHEFCVIAIRFRPRPVIHEKGVRVVIDKIKRFQDFVA